MRRKGIPKTRQELRYRRHLRIRNRVKGSAERPRLVIFRSLKHIYAQLVDDVSKKTVLTIGDGKLTGKKAEKASEVGKALAAAAKEQGIAKVVERLLWEQEVVSSNLAVPTTLRFKFEIPDLKLQILSCPLSTPPRCLPSKPRAGSIARSLEWK